MKKLFLLTTLLSLSLVSCGDDDKTTDPIVTPVDNTQTLLTAKWNLVKGEYYQNGTLVQTEDLKPGTCDYDYYDLKSGGLKDEIYHNEEDDCSTENYDGTWSYNSATKEVTLIDTEDNYTIITEVISINATDLKIKMISEDGEAVPDGVEAYLYLKK